jgi:AcrR family transcriptional regulator
MLNPTADATAESALVAPAGPTPTTRGTRSRAGNAMGRTREAALSGAVAAVTKYGSRKATMGDVAMLAGIAKATLYNHFRTKDDVYAAVVEAEVEAIAAAAVAKLPSGFDVALAEAAGIIADSPAIRRVVAQEPAVAAGLATPGEGTAWTSARAHVARALQQAGLDDAAVAVDLILRYLASQVLAPSGPAERAAAAALITGAVASSHGEARAEPAPGSALAGSSDTSS